MMSHSKARLAAAVCRVTGHKSATDQKVPTFLSQNKDNLSATTSWNQCPRTWEKCGTLIQGPDASIADLQTAVLNNTWRHTDRQNKVLDPGPPLAMTSLFHLLQRCAQGYVYITWLLHHVMSQSEFDVGETDLSLARNSSQDAFDQVLSVWWCCC